MRYNSRAIYSRPVLEDGSTIFAIWPKYKTGSFISGGGQLQFANTGSRDVRVVVGPIPVYIDSRTSLSISDITKPSYLLQSDHYLGIDPRGYVAEQVASTETQDSGFAYTVDSEAAWTTEEENYAKEYIRTFGMCIPPGGLYEPFIPTQFVTYLMSDKDNKDLRGLLLWV